MRTLGHPDAPCVGSTSFVSDVTDAGEIADGLDKCGIAVRGGLHCAPAVHTWLGTLQSGAVRVSPGIYTTERDVADALMALRQVLRP